MTMGNGAPSALPPVGRPIEDADLVNRFSYHAPTVNQAERYMRLRAAALELGRQIVANTPTSREQSLAITHLEEAIYAANAAIARNE